MDTGREACQRCDSCSNEAEEEMSGLCLTRSVATKQNNPKIGARLAVWNHSEAMPADVLRCLLASEHWRQLEGACSAGWRKQMHLT